MGWLAVLFGCGGGPIERHPSIVPPTSKATVRVLAYREENIAKAANQTNIHSYATFEVLSADARLTDHATDGALQLNMRQEVLAKAGALPLVQGQQLTLFAKPNYMSPPYVVVERFEVLPTP